MFLKIGSKRKLRNYFLKIHNHTIAVILITNESNTNEYTLYVSFQYKINDSNVPNDNLMFTFH